MIRYRPFELHTHTVHSDGDFTPAALVQAAHDFGCAGIALTDHNTDAGMQEIYEAARDSLLPVIPGIEWTTYYGHMLVIACQRYVDWRFAKPDTIDDYIADVVASDGVVGIAHPFSMGGVLYTGGFWEFQVQNWERVSYVEVWSKGENDTRVENERALAWWTGMLNQGHRLALTAGRDWHRPDEKPRLCALTYLGLLDGEITPDMVKDALRRGRTFVTFGPTVAVEVRQDGRCFGLGDTLQAGHTQMTVSVDETARKSCWQQWEIRPEAVRLTANGTMVREEPYTGQPICFAFEAEEGWMRIELLGSHQGGQGNRELLAMTSPIYVHSCS